MKFTKVFASILTHGLLATGLVSAAVLPRAGRTPTPPNRTPSPPRPMVPAVAHMDMGPAVAALNQAIGTEGLATCISISAIGIPTDPRSPNKVMTHIGAMAQQGQGAIPAFFQRLHGMGFRPASTRVTITHPGPNYVNTAYMNDKDFRQMVDQGERMRPGFKARLQATLNSLVRDAQNAAVSYTRANGGAFGAIVRADPLPAVLPARSSNHVINADGSEKVEGKVIHKKFP
ncbi:hypothetical protein HJFPF1_04478 [Paramyrothecium foliicola]|nr:hypothetical protein HJFPF1_04478 [Paramyrothecium foliicola]